MKFLFRAEGCPEDEYSTPFLRQIRTGIRKTLPSLPDDRRALLLPTMTQRPQFYQDDNPTNVLFPFATIIGFVGMLRPHTFEQLNPDSFTLVMENGRCTQLRGAGCRFNEQLNDIRAKDRILGFYITFDSKTMRKARAYLPSLCSRERLTELEAMCPMRALTRVSGLNLVKKAFLKKVMRRGKEFTRYLSYISDVKDEYAPYALRIGGRTWFLNRGLDRQFCDFLGA